ncbi:MAG TPA: heme ABC exporter ATP-binding protein CcmA [Gemmatimonadales bacterium]|nr:heme ABC exporter ATP-binding protein CcmA [Gemmatimonadales bacterium]
MPSSDAPLLAAAGLERSFGRTRVLRGVDLAVGAGETLAVFGPNGAGKTTLLRILAGLMRPSRGEVRILGRPLRRGAADARRPIGLLSHQPMLYGDLTLAENLEFAARLYDLDDPAGAARRALAAVGLDDRAASPVRELSRGLVQRGAIARALLHDPRVLLLDEPFTGLDAAAADRLRALLRREAAGGRALVIVTHVLEEAWELADRVGVLVAGRWALEEPRPGPLAAFVPRYRELIGV